MEISPPDKNSFLAIAQQPNFAVSPDGRFLVFSGDEAGRGTRLWIRPLDSAVSQQLTATVGGRIPFWSPDSRYIGFFADGKLKKVDVSGGAPLTLSNVTSPFPGNTGLGGTWNREGTIVFSPSPSSGLFRVPENGGEAVPVTQLQEKTERSHAWPQFLPDGSHFIYFSFGKTAELNGIYAGSLDGATPKLVMKSQSRGAYASGYLLFMRETVLMAQPFDMKTLSLTSEPVRVADQIAVSTNSGTAEFAASESGIVAYRSTAGGGANQQFAWADREGKRIEINTDLAMYRTHDLSPDGKRLAAHRHDDSNNSGDIWITELERGLTSRFTFDGSHNFAPIWSPDGSSIVYSSTREGAVANLYKKASSGAAKEELLLETNETKQVDDWSRDGRYILYEVAGQTRRDLWVLPLSGDRKPIPFLNTPFNERKGRFSPDGKWIAYTSDESGEDQIYIQPFPPSGGKWQISTNGGFEPRWHGDGKELYYVSSTTDRKLMAVSIRWTSIPEPGAPQEIVPIQFGSMGVDGANQYVVTADGQRFIIQSSAQQQGGPQPITVLVNWLAGLSN